MLTQLVMSARDLLLFKAKSELFTTREYKYFCPFLIISWREKRTTRIITSLKYIFLLNSFFFFSRCSIKSYQIET